jgi:site-specific recombinase
MLEPSRKKKYTDAEIVVLCAVFSAVDFSVGDDEREECQRIASAFNRSPGTIDRQWRNIKDWLAGKSIKNTGQRVKYWAQILSEDPALIRRSAERYCKIYGWDLYDLIHKK